MNDFDALQSRLHDLGTLPVDEAVAERHLASFAFAATSAPPVRSRTRMIVAGALVAGSVVGSATLAGAVTGRLPDTAQEAAHTALAKVGLDVPKGPVQKADKAGKAGKATTADTDDDGTKGVERYLEGCTNPDGSPFEGNHGQYVKAHPDKEDTPDVNEREQAAKSRCGKPIQAGTGEDDGTEDDATTTDDHGKPESPGKSGEHKPDDTGKPDTAGKSGDHKPAGTGKPAADTED